MTLAASLLTAVFNIDIIHVNLFPYDPLKATSWPSSALGADSS